MANQPKNPGDTLSNDTASTAHERLENFQKYTAIVTFAAVALAFNPREASASSNEHTETSTNIMQLTSEASALAEPADPTVEATTIPTLEPTMSVPTESVPTTVPTVKPTVKPTPKPTPKPPVKPPIVKPKDKRPLEAEPRYKGRKFNIVFHRGGVGSKRGIPKNSMDAYKLANQRHANVIEADEQRGFIYHGETLDEETNKSGNFLKVSRKKIREARLNTNGGWEKIPTVGEFLNYVGKHSRADVALELKERRRYSDKRMIWLGKMIKKNGLDKRTVINARQDSGGWENLKRWNKLQKQGKIDKDIRLAVIYRKPQSTESMRKNGIDQVFVDKDLVSKGLVAKWKRNGMKVSAWTTNSTTKAKQLLNKGVNEIVTDAGPSMVREFDPNVKKRQKLYLQGKYTPRK